jgi:hypothetical protein
LDFLTIDRLWTRHQIVYHGVYLVRILLVLFPTFPIRFEIDKEGRVGVRGVGTNWLKENNVQLISFKSIWRVKNTIRVGKQADSFMFSTKLHP